MVVWTAAFNGTVKHLQTNRHSVRTLAYELALRYGIVQLVELPKLAKLARLATLAKLPTLASHASC